MLQSRSTQLHTIGLAVALPCLLIAGACSREAKQTAPVTTQTDSGKASRAPESAKAANEMDQALVRVVNAAPETKAIDVLADNNLTFSAVDYKTVTPYKNVPSSADDFAIKPSGETAAQPIAKNSESISGGRHYTMIVYPGAAPDAKTEVQVINDDITPPSEGKARVRVINAAPDAHTIAAFVKGRQDALFTDVDFKEAMSYKEVDPVTETLEFRTVSSRMAATDVPTAAAREPSARDAKADNPRNERNEPTVATARVTFEPGKTYTIVVASGQHKGRTGGLDTIVIEDSLGAPHAAPTN